MFSKLAVLAFATMAVFVAAAPSGGEGGINNSCNSGPVQCCNSVHDSENEKITSIASLLNVLIPINTQVGVSCSPISAIGVGSGANCQSQPVCCSDNSFSGIIAIGCSPININL